MIPTETDLNALPLLSSIPERVLPIAATQSKTNEGNKLFPFSEYFSFENHYTWHQINVKSTVMHVYDCTRLEINFTLI